MPVPPIPHATSVRLGIFFGIFFLMALAEVFSARRARTCLRRDRWPQNIALAVVDALLGRWVLPMGAVGFSVWAEQRQFGLFPYLGAGAVISWIATILLLDLAIYWQHRLFHLVPVFWRLHRVHHSDVDLDVTSGARFHPLEILLSLGWKGLVIFLLGAPAGAVFIFEILLNAGAMFNHSNVRLPAAWERWGRRVLVTPDMHRVHHSVVVAETDSNFGFNLSVWDRLFRTYRAEPAAGQEGMTIGLAEFREKEEQRFSRLLTQPFRQPKSRSGD